MIYRRNQILIGFEIFKRSLREPTNFLRVKGLPKDAIDP